MGSVNTEDVGDEAYTAVAMFVFGVNGEAAARIIGSGSALTPIIGATAIGVAKANEKKDDGKK